MALLSYPLAVSVLTLALMAKAIDGKSKHYFPTHAIATPIVNRKSAFAIQLLILYMKRKTVNSFLNAERTLHSAIFQGYDSPSFNMKVSEGAWDSTTTWMVYFVTGVVVLLLAYRVVLEQLNEMAWFAAVERMKRDDATKKRPVLFDYTYGWTFIGISPPKYGVENMFHTLIHLPAYTYRYIRLLIWILPRDAFRRYVLRMKVTDKQLYDFITHTMLIMLCDTDETGDILTYKAESCCKELFITKDEHVDCPIDGSTLVVVFNKGVIVEERKPKMLH